MNLSIEEKIAVVTGGDSGMGFETAKILAKEGATVVLSDKTGQELLSAAHEVRKYARRPDQVLAVTADLTDNEQVQSLADQLKATFGEAHILANFAGLGERREIF